MKATKKTLLAASVVSAMAAAGSANAATVATYDVGAAITSIIFHFPDRYSTPCSTCAPVLIDPAHDGNILANGGVTNAGTAVLDDSGTLTITGAVINTQTFFGTSSLQTLNATFSGAWNGTSFTPSSGSFYYTACQDLVADPNLASCGSSSAKLNTTFTYASVSGAAGALGGSLGGVNSTTSSNSSYAFTLTPTVPVPAAMWLFGSGLLGLAGTARRRRAA